MLTRAASRHNLALKWVKETMRRNETFLLVIFSETAVSTENVNIDQQIYFLTESYDIFEKYKINGHLVRRKLGRFLNNDYQGESKDTYISTYNTVAINELLCLKNAGAQISMFFTSNE